MHEREDASAAREPSPDRHTVELDPRLLALEHAIRRRRNLERALIDRWLYGALASRRYYVSFLGGNGRYAAAKNAEGWRSPDPRPAIA